MEARPINYRPINYRIIPKHVRDHLHNGGILDFAFCTGTKKHPCGQPCCFSSLHPEHPRIVELCCHVHACPISTWFVCLDCKQRIGRSRLSYHLGSRNHTKIKEQLLTLKNAEGLWDDRTSMASEPTPWFIDDDASACAPTRFAPLPHEVSEISPNSNPKLDLTLQYSSMPYSMENQWLSVLFEDLPIASVSDINESFDPNRKENRVLASFWCTESASPKDRCGAGAQRLVAQAFSQSSLLTKEMFPSITVSKLHMLQFIQYNSMSTKQRRRQEEIDEYTSQNMSSGPDLFSSRSYRELSRIYSSNAKNSIWTNIPIPSIEMIDGIAYVKPLNQIRFAASFAIPLEECWVDAGFFSRDATKDARRKVFKLTDSREYRRKLLEIAVARREAGLLEERVLVLGCSVWRDGFMGNRTKNNRTSPLLFTFSVGTPSYSSNTGNNTFTCAIGKKNNTSWHKVEGRFNSDMKELTNPLHPIHVYHGGLRKVIPVICTEDFGIYDKPERAEITKTLDGGTYHQCFGKVVHFQKPKVNLPRLLHYVQQCSNGTIASRWGWSSTFLNNEVGNGGRFGSCYLCRSYRLAQLGLIQVGAHPVHLQSAPQPGPQCTICANWDLNDGLCKSKMSFPPPEKYPKKEADSNCPVDFPLERKPGIPLLPVMDLSFSLLKQCCRVAFYHSSRNSKYAWNKGTCMDYLKSCGVNTAFSEVIWDSAKQHRNEIGDVDYTNPHGIGDHIQFPASWIGNVPMEDYVEALMHQLFLGIAQTNMEICDNYLKSNRLGVETFRRSIQPLLDDIRSLQLSWLLVLPFNVDKNKKSHTTGSWMGENWSAFVRISPVVYATLLKDGVKSERIGSKDVSRTIVAFHAFVSIVMTHSGLDDAMIRQCIDLMKEFMSSLLELDLRSQVNLPTDDGVSTQKAKKGKKSKSKKRRRLDTGLASEPMVDKQEQETAKKSSKASVESTMNSVGETTPNRWVDFTPTWYKQNYLSIFNIPEMMRRHGPVVNYYDGGGKGEKGIQQVKPHLTKGIPPHHQMSHMGQ